MATSAEDSTVRLWDLRDGGVATRGSGSSPSSPRVATCLCRCFGGEAVTSVVFGAGDVNRLYCSAGGKVGVVKVVVFAHASAQINKHGSLSGTKLVYHRSNGGR